EFLVDGIQSPSRLLKASPTLFRYTHIKMRTRIKIRASGSLPAHLRLYGILPSNSITSTSGLITPPGYLDSSTTLTLRVINIPFCDQTSCSEYSMKPAAAAFDSSNSSNQHGADLYQRVSAASGGASGSSMKPPDRNRIHYRSLR